MTDFAEEQEASKAGEAAVIPVKAGIQRLRSTKSQRHWIPAFAGMTGPQGDRMNPESGRAAAIRWTPAFAEMAGWWMTDFAEEQETSTAGKAAVIPAKAGIQRLRSTKSQRHWIPAFAGMTGWWVPFAGMTGWWVPPGRE